MNLNFHTIFFFECVVPADEGIRGKGRIVQYHPPVSVLSWPAHVSGENGKRVWLLFFMTGVAAIDLTMSSMMTVPVAMSAVILPNLVRKNAGDRAGSICLLCCRVLVLGVYLLGVRGILQIPVVR